jgi:UDP-glucose:glycoprotein glucosyltransferase
MQIVAAELDTDNLKLDDLGGAAGTTIGAELEAIMLTGTCIDVSFARNGDPYPRGTQLILQDSAGRALQDTLVMSNLGYFQLKTAPGMLMLGPSLCPESDLLCACQHAPVIMC